jgi:uncharacterized Zn finger protein
MQPVRSLIRSNNPQSHASSADVLQGQEYFSQNQTRITHTEDANIQGEVKDPVSNQTYQVTFTGGDFGLSWQCTCGSNGGTAGGAMMCPHAVAVALAAQ